MAGLTGALVAGRKARQRGRTAVAEAATHPHYCAECDQEWPHAGRTCLHFWASFCPKCCGAFAGTDVAQAGSGVSADGCTLQRR